MHRLIIAFPAPGTFTIVDPYYQHHAFVDYFDYKLPEDDMIVTKHIGVDNL
jgi:hypothetical protein